MVHLQQYRICALAVHAPGLKQHQFYLLQVMLHFEHYWKKVQMPA
jgi:hypothetical protein